ncbi:MAG: bifunctional phosphopantothenoylcysteine decarboxylase/phosphopantothenate--cysteine ligase CoaBC [Thermovirgaceae bacterium]|nr:bifunctional phosphopantothenoylcysteine decarboxylase/phosphopantothenate--cysteine ligase CoaBC [Thermovirgaceae bacterium]
MTLEWKTSRRILLGVCGGISAYKAPEIVREFRKQGWDVEVVLSLAAERFVSPLVISTLTGRKVWREEDFLSAEYGWKIPHISLAEWADVTVVAPATASFLQKAAHGDASSTLSASLLVTRSPVLLFPAMNVFMWEHGAVRDNVDRCSDLGYRIVEPEEGALACGYEGKGRLPSIEVIREETFRAVAAVRDMTGLRVLVTSGPTREAIDPVRFISNPSSGKMGSALARTAWYRGAEVTVISGPATEPVPYGVRMIPVVSAGEMFDAVMQEAPSHDIIVKAAAVGDFTPIRAMDKKIKREEGKNLVLEMVPNQDIAAALGASKKPGQFLVGFAAETDDAIANATRKLVRKGLDLIVLNDVQSKSSAFGSENNSVSIIGKEGIKAEFSGSKEEVADVIWEIVSLSRGAAGGQPCSSRS